jgi:hypothetical protein
MGLCRMTALRASAPGGNRSCPSHARRLVVTLLRVPPASAAARWHTGPEHSTPPGTPLPQRPPVAERSAVCAGTDITLCHSRSDRTRVCVAADQSARALVRFATPRCVLRVTGRPSLPCAVRARALAIPKAAIRRHGRRSTGQAHPPSRPTRRLPCIRRTYTVRDDDGRSRAHPFRVLVRSAWFLTLWPNLTMGCRLAHGGFAAPDIVRFRPIPYWGWTPDR